MLYEVITQEHVADDHPMVPKVGLGGPALAEQAIAIRQKHGVMMAERRAVMTSLACANCVVAQTQIAIGRARRDTRRDRQADGPPFDDWRRSAAGGAIEPLAAENDTHAWPGAPTGAS